MSNKMHASDSHLLEVTRALEICVGQTTLPLPSFFPSVSSVKTNLAPVDYVELLVASDYPSFLVSAYDIAYCTSGERIRMDVAIEQGRENGLVTLMDSGNYEKYWKNGREWQREKFHEIASHSYHPLCFCFDNQQPPYTSELIAADVVESVTQDQKYALGTVAPIVHGNLHLLPEATRRTAEQLYPLVVAVPERELGEGILERMRTIRRIREALNALEVYCPLHILGTGDPLAIISYVLAGADSFDGLEWCQTVVDHETGKLSHFQQWDLIRHQTEWGIHRELPFVQTVLMHNLYFYRQFMQKLRDAVQHQQLESLIQHYTTNEQAAILVRAGSGNE